MNSSEAMIMRATQKKMMSGPVTSVSVGKNFCRSSLFSGQPRVLNGQSHELNQVSSTSSSWRSSVLPHSGQEAGVSRRTMVWPRSQYQTGTRWPHQIWRLMHQSRMLVIQ